MIAWYRRLVSRSRFGLTTTPLTGERSVRFTTHQANDCRTQVAQLGDPDCNAAAARSQRVAREPSVLFPLSISLIFEFSTAPCNASATTFRVLDEFNKPGPATWF
jgi:hypothetical protein